MSVVSDYTTGFYRTTSTMSWADMEDDDDSYCEVTAVEADLPEKLLILGAYEADVVEATIEVRASTKTEEAARRPTYFPRCHYRLVRAPALDTIEEEAPEDLSPRVGTPSTVFMIEDEKARPRCAYNTETDLWSTEPTLPCEVPNKDLWSPEPTSPSKGPNRVLQITEPKLPSDVPSSDAAPPETDLWSTEPILPSKVPNKDLWSTEPTRPSKVPNRDLQSTEPIRLSNVPSSEAARFARALKKGMLFPINVAKQFKKFCRRRLIRRPI